MGAGANTVFAPITHLEMHGHERIDLCIKLLLRTSRDRQSLLPFSVHKEADELLQQFGTVTVLCAVLRIIG